MQSLQNLTLPTRKYALGAGIAGEGLKYFKYWIIAAVLIGSLGTFSLSLNWDVDLSVWMYIANAGKYFTGAVAWLFLYALLPGMIANGLTRRELTVTMGVFGLLWGLALASLNIGMFFAEHAYYDAMGWTQAVAANEVEVPIATWGDVARTAAPFLALYPLYFLGGAIIGAAAYRWAGTGWLLLFPIVIVVVGLDDALAPNDAMGPGWVRFATGFTQDWTIGLVAAAIAVAFAVGAWALKRLLGDIPVRTKKA